MMEVTGGWLYRGRDTQKINRNISKLKYFYPFYHHPTDIYIFPTTSVFVCIYRARNHNKTLTQKINKLTNKHNIECNTKGREKGWELRIETRVEMLKRRRRQITTTTMTMSNNEEQHKMKKIKNRFI